MSHPTYSHPIDQTLSIEETLCTIGDLCKVCSVTRRMLLNYEEHGLLKPVTISKDSGYRYYGAQSVARVRHIRTFQQYGFSLDDIARYMAGDETVLQKHYDHLLELRAGLDYQIDRMETLMTPRGQFTVFRTTLSADHYAITTKECPTLQDRFCMAWRFTAYVLNRRWPVSSTGGLIAILHTNPDSPNFGKVSTAWPLKEPNKESVYFPECDALCINLKGPVQQIPQAIELLRQYAREHSLPDHGDIRLIYIASHQSHSNPENHATKVCLELPAQ